MSAAPRTKVERSVTSEPIDERWEETVAGILVQRFDRRIRAMARRQLRDPSLAEDVAQETLLRVMEALQEGRLQDCAALPSFIFQTARHVCLQWRRKCDREGKALESLGRERERRARTITTRRTSLHRARQATAVVQALSQMSPGDRQVLDLSYYRDLDSSQIAQQLGASPGAVRVRRHRALQRLGDALRKGP